MAAFGQDGTGMGGQRVASSRQNRNAWRGEYTRGVARPRKYRASGSAGAIGSGSQGTPYAPQETPASQPAPLPVAAAYNASPQPFAAYAPQASDTMYTGGTPNFDERTGQPTAAPVAPQLPPAPPAALPPAPTPPPVAQVASPSVTPSPPAAVRPGAAQPQQPPSQGTAYAPQATPSAALGRRLLPARQSQPDPAFDEYMRSAGVMRNAATESEVGYDREVQKMRDDWNRLDAPNKQFQLERARAGQLGPGRLSDRPDTARDAEAQKSLESLGSGGARSGPASDSPDDKYGYEWDQAQAYVGPTVSSGPGFGDMNQRAKASTREDWINQRKQWDTQSAASLRAASDKMASREKMLRETPGLSQETSDWVMATNTAAPRQPSQQVWDELRGTQWGQSQEWGKLSYQDALNRQSAFNSQVERDAAEQRSRGVYLRPGQYEPMGFWNTMPGNVPDAGRALAGLLGDRFYQ